MQRKVEIERMTRDGHTYYYIVRIFARPAWAMGTRRPWAAEAILSGECATWRDASRKARVYCEGLTDDQALALLR